MSSVQHTLFHYFIFNIEIISYTQNINNKTSVLNMSSVQHTLFHYFIFNIEIVSYTQNINNKTSVLNMSSVQHYLIHYFIISYSILKLFHTLKCPVYNIIWRGGMEGEFFCVHDLEPLQYFFFPSSFSFFWHGSEFFCFRTT